MCIMLLSVTGLLAQNKKGPTFNVSSFNLRMDTQSDGEDAWPNRKEMVKGLIRFHDLDIVGTQEGFKHQLDGILELGDYAYVGAGRDNGEPYRLYLGYAGHHRKQIRRAQRYAVRTFSVGSLPGDDQRRAVTL